MSIEGALSTAEFKKRNDEFNTQAQELENKLKTLKTEEEKSHMTIAQLDKIKAVLGEELSFENGINSELVTTILDHIVVKKGSTIEKIQLDIYLKFGDPYEVAFDQKNSSFCINRLITYKAEGKMPQKASNSAALWDIIRDNAKAATCYGCAFH